MGSKSFISGPKPAKSVKAKAVFYLHNKNHKGVLSNSSISIRFLGIGLFAPVEETKYPAQRDLILRPHGVNIVTLRSNVRQCSDIFEIFCHSGKKLRVDFAMHTSNREILSYIATKVGIPSEILKDPMAESIEYRSAESNGMTESDVMTFKRDYVCMI